MAEKEVKEVHFTATLGEDQFDRMDANHDGVLQRTEWDRGVQDELPSWRDGHYTRNRKNM